MLQRIFSGVFFTSILLNPVLSIADDMKTQQPSPSTETKQPQATQTQPASETSQATTKTTTTPQTVTQSTTETKNMSIKEKNLMAGKAFLDENQKKPGVVTLPSGLQYKIIKAGSGESPGPTDFVTVHYRGTLIDGTEFDSSYKRGDPTTFPINAIIPGWSEALQLMQPGAKWMLYIPANLAYGEQGAAQVIAPNATLIFEVELISIKQPSSDQNDEEPTTDGLEDDG